MPEPFPSDSVGLVEPQRKIFDEPISLISGRSLPGYELVYETYGELNSAKTNAVLICHALSGDHHAAGYYENENKPGWWDSCIGPGKPFDTNKFHIVSVNNIGSCKAQLAPIPSIRKLATITDLTSL
jgi:homoserine O-acetyltransferase